MATLLERGLRDEGYAVDVAVNGTDGLWLGYSSQGPGALYPYKPDLCAASQFSDNEDAYAGNTGTSAACALASGVVARLRGKWDGKTAELVQKGIEREKAGTPGAAEIDATFRDLTTATGKDWLTTYRKSAQR